MVEASLAQARAAIQEVQRNNETSYDPDYVPTGAFYRDANAFHRSYLEMEKQFKIYIYEDGEPPLYHYSTSLGILGIEGILIHQIEISKFRTRDPRKAHVYFIPISGQSIAGYAYEIGNRAWSPLQNIIRDYVRLISTKYPYWNRTLGYDHFILGCHDWTPTISGGVKYLFENSIRVLCNANTSEGFKPSIDVSLPEIYLPDGTMDGLIGGPPPSERSILVFYAGGVHGYIREVLMEKWKDKDPDVQVHEYLPQGMSYYGMFRKSKYCICPSGWEVASPRMVEALYMGCVPVLLKDHYAKPFDDVLDWSTFAVDVQVNEISDLKKILMAIPHEQYLEMQKIGILVRRHFEVNFPPKRYDVFHMILHSIWLRRINIQLHDTHES
ncbi:Acetylglucosaminyltransferase EXT1/exostosin 1 [Handroanthus impetiginosus]|uniref:Acetylglucosaminyltransferase EXT1/exostosin 1 n=1 Tax=Handroanthus impetiginosus TaxID=429701 RepID=A0A2G9GY09_9LAMI|nr:Acetylglucosaminyltransferase EXT1/exostosin 1 [Handroanthus impetiginosus]